MMVEYVEGDSLFHNLDPRVKVILLLLFTLLIFMAKNFILIGILFGIVIGFWYSSNLSFKKIANFLKILVWLFVFLIIVQGVFYPGTHYIINPLIPNFIPGIGGLGNITWEGILFGILICFRLLTLLSLLPLITMTTEVHLLALGLVKMGLPYKIAYMATTALNMIPTFEEEANIIMDAQRLRAYDIFDDGHFYDKLKAYPALVVPLVVGAMRRAKLMGVAMDARAFGADEKRTYLEDIEMDKKDKIALGCLIVFTLIIIIIKFVYWG